MKPNQSSADALESTTIQISKRAAEKFAETLVSGVSNPELLTVLQTVRSYWIDTTRSTLTALSCQAVGGKPESVEDANVVFSLTAAGISLHDDIIDRTRRKHFRMTILGLYGPDKALIAGDLLLTKAFAKMHEFCAEIKDQVIAADIIKTYRDCLLEMSEAGFIEISCKKKLDTELELSQQVLWRIAAEMETCSKVGAILGNGQTNEIQALAAFGRRLGFNLGLKSEVEDVLNLEGNLPSELEYERIPLPLLYAAKASQKNFSEIHAVLENSPIAPLGCRRLLELCFETEAMEFVKGLAAQNTEAALSALSSLNFGSARDRLRGIMENSFEELSQLCI